MINNSSKKKNSPYSIDLLTKLLIEYPVINTANIDLKVNFLEASFLIKREINNMQWEEIKKNIVQKISVFKKLESRNEFYFKIVKKSYSNLTQIKFISKLDQLSDMKIDFIINIIEKEFSNELLVEEIGENKVKSDSIKKLLELAKTEKNSEYKGFREKNKIFIYDITS